MTAMNSLTAVGSPPSRAPESRPARAPTPVRPSAFSGNWLATQGRLPLAFMGLGLAWLVAATALLVVPPTLLTRWGLALQGIAGVALFVTDMLGVLKHFWAVPVMAPAAKPAAAR